MILVCGSLADEVTELVCARLAARGYSYRLLDLRVYPSGFKIKWRWQDGIPSGYIAGNDWNIDLQELTGVYIRYFGTEGRLPPSDITADAAAPLYAEHDAGLMALLEDLPCAVVNRIGGGMSNNSKAYQAKLIRQCGLSIPPTLVTNDPEAALRFYNEFRGDIIYKSLSGIRSIVRRLEPTQLSRLPLLRSGPAQFQSFIHGDNVRVHTVGQQVFATRIRSKAVDYRYAATEGCSIEMEPTVLPPAIQSACLKLARRLNLLLTGIDFKETPDGEYFCFEINPSPGFLYYERYDRQPISAALADLLHNGKEFSFETKGMLPIP